MNVISTNKLLVLLSGLSHVSADIIERQYRPPAKKYSGMLTKFCECLFNTMFVSCCYLLGTHSEGFWFTSAS